MFCSKCGSPIQDGHKFCMNCGAPVEQSTPQTQGTSQIVNPKPQVQSTSQPVIPKPPMQNGSQTSGEGKPKKRKTMAMVVMIVVAALLVIMVALLLMRIFVLDEKPQKESDSVWSNVGEDESEAGVQEDISGLLEEKLEDILKEKGDITDLATDIRYGREIQNTEGVTGALIQDVSGDGADDLIVVYAQENCLYADVYTVEDKEVVQKGDHLLGNDAFSNSTANIILGGVYLKENAEGWILVADSWQVANLFADGLGRNVKAVNCSEHSYDRVADFEYLGSAWEESEIQDGIQAAENIGMSDITDPMDGPFFRTDQNVTAICVFHDEITPMVGNVLEQVDVGETYGTFYSTAVTDENYRADDAALAEILIAYQQYETDYEEACEELSMEISDYILPQSADTELTAEDLADIKDDKWLLKVARNEIFARYGRKFQDENLQAYFDEKDWYEPLYEPDEFDESMVSDLEMSNAKFIKDYEDKLE